MRQVKLLYFTDNKEACKELQRIVRSLLAIALAILGTAKEFIGKFRQIYLPY